MKGKKPEEPLVKEPEIVEPTPVTPIVEEPKVIEPIVAVPPLAPTPVKNTTPPRPPLPSRGLKVPEGVTFKDLTLEQRRAYFRQHEENWKGRFNKVPGQNQRFDRG